MWRSGKCHLVAIRWGYQFLLQPSPSERTPLPAPADAGDCTRHWTDHEPPAVWHVEFVLDCVKHVITVRCDDMQEAKTLEKAIPTLVKKVQSGETPVQVEDTPIVLKPLAAARAQAAMIGCHDWQNAEVGCEASMCQRRFLWLHYSIGGDKIPFELLIPGWPEYALYIE
jgi:hypothetical protein